MEKMYVIIVQEYDDHYVVGVAHSVNAAENWVDENLREVLDLEDEAIIKRYSSEWQRLTYSDCYPYSDCYVKQIDVQLQPGPGYDESWDICIEPCKLVG